MTDLGQIVLHHALQSLEQLEATTVKQPEHHKTTTD